MSRSIWLKRSEVWIEVKESTVKVSSSRVKKVSTVRSLRRFMLEMPSWKAVSEAPARDTSVSWMTATSVRSFFICSLNLPEMIHITSTASARMTKASRMTKGLDSWKAGCTSQSTIQMTEKTPAKPSIWLRMVAALMSRRSVKKAHGITSAMKKMMPWMTSFCVALTSG